MSRHTYVVLIGGPPGTPPLWNTPPATDLDRVKVPLGNGYEHFEFTGQYLEMAGEQIPVYGWCYRTFIAE
ncbi:hypothetical protein FHS39_004543 [Streptomyces olivoverticillatus]|uniref:Uncharacterized protein n=1 Tax=Streptomyces olivoverticillatus TaxID=66427 RepID=A0A7W7LS80_9ACTN|nr:DUF5988 family protein [Streptomyces olivoverticillatus]MBB4895465.1 hypothetical protein [Streptomyces olivoverticillatus]